MQRLEVSCAVGRIYMSLGAKGLNLNFLDGFSKNSQISNFTIPPVAVKLFHA